MTTKSTKKHTEAAAPKVARRSTRPPAPDLRDVYADGFANIRRDFQVTGDGRAAVLERTALVDKVVRALYAEFISPDAAGPEQFCVAALGGFGRGALFPCSDIDLLFLCDNSRVENEQRPSIARVCREMWDIGLRASPSTRTLAECERLHRDNLEFNIATLDCRYIVGDRLLFQRLREEVIPKLVKRERQVLVANLADLTTARHHKFARTIFHLEPNIKDTPGGLRDQHVAAWLAQIAALEKHGAWLAEDELLPPETRAEIEAAVAFLFATRCFLHYRHGRDDNGLTYEAQAEAAAAGIGAGREPVPTGEWMRMYFRHARTLCRAMWQVLEDVQAAKSSLYGRFENWRSRLSNADFSVIHDRVFLREPQAVRDVNLLLSLFEFIARHGVKLSADTERRVARAIAELAGDFSVPDLWRRLKNILVLPHAAQALRAMHELGALGRMLPEFNLIDALVVRDFYHRYTVDEHSLRTIEIMQQLRSPQDESERRFGEILSELEQPELLFLALLLHDLGKGTSAENHVEASLTFLDAIFARLQLEAAAADTVRWLIASHLEMSMTLMRRDIFDGSTVRSFAERVGTTERLKMLALLTYGDIRAVNPEAMTPWKAETLWQLYAGTSNRLTRSVDELRLSREEFRSRAVAQVASSAQVEADAISNFLEGFPRRYLLTHTAEEVAEHFAMAQKLGRRPLSLSLGRRGHLHQLTLITADRPALFASVAGTLVAWGMNIVKADAFANRAGIILDIFQFADMFHTLDLNPTEAERFKQSVADVLQGEVCVEDLLASRWRTAKVPIPKVRVEPRISFDTEASSHSTLMEVIAQDRPGLLYELSAKMAKRGCNVEVALIDTEGQKAIDVFYLTAAGRKLDETQCRELRDELLKQL